MQKTHTRTVITLAHGAFQARETRQVCDASPSVCPPVGSATLARLVKPRHRYGYDLVVHAGLARYLHATQREEIRTELRDAHQIDLATGTVSGLCDQFLVYLEALHEHRAPQLRAAMAAGYALHLDATCEAGKGGLFVTLDGLRGWVLGAARIPSENHIYLAPVIEKTVALFGDPLATMRDLGDAGAKAVAPLRERGIRDLLCHFHFLRALGTKLFDPLYGELRTLLRKSRVAAGLKSLLRELHRYQEAEPNTYDGSFGAGLVRDGLLALVLWVLEGTGTKDLTYPFGLPQVDFVHRARQLPEVAERFLPCPRTQPEWAALGHLHFLARPLDAPPFVPLAQQLQDHQHAFRELRDALGLTHAELPGGTSSGARPLELPALELARLQEIETSFTAYEKRLQRSRSPAAATLRTYVERYRTGLFGHPAVRAPNGAILAVVSRVNNVSEHFFGQGKQLLRRRLGRAHLGRDMEQQPAQAAFTRNLRDPTYVQVLCGSLDRLPEAFAALDAQNLVPPVASLRDHRRATLHRLARSLLAPIAPP
ncbi:MAG: hypothetical protein P1P84_25290 [Deferrisomatales bacterium]|nr:hypothetical protein [Deferrisomatales bacterium]